MSKLKCLNCSVREEAVEGLYGDVDILEPHLEPVRSSLPPRHLGSAKPPEPPQCHGSRLVDLYCPFPNISKHFQTFPNIITSWKLEGQIQFL